MTTLSRKPERVRDMGQSTFTWARKHEVVWLTAMSRENCRAMLCYDRHKGAIAGRLPMISTSLEDWLTRHGLERYRSVLASNDIDREALPHLTDSDLRELGLSLGHRRKFLAAVAAETTRASTDTVAAQPSADAERRQLTILFCDLVNSTELSLALDPEDLREVMRRYHEAVAAAIRKQEGHVAKLLGDGVLAYFGWPQAREGQAESAVRAALGALAAVVKIEAAGSALAARAGIATGPVVVGDTEGPAHEKGAVSGATPNLAARLQARAEPGQVLIHESTRLLIGEAFALEDAGSTALKGFAGPVSAWRVLGPSRRPNRFETLHSGRLTSFIGRSHEIGLLVSRWQVACAGQGQAVLLSGEAGIGKSRVLREFEQAVALAPDRIVRWQCSPHDLNTPFHPLVAEIEARSGFVLGESQDERREKLAAHVGTLWREQSSAEEALALLADLLAVPAGNLPALEMTPQRRKQRMISMLVERTQRLSDAGPLAVLLEDVHWADPSTLEFLEVLVPQLLHRRIAAMMTLRPRVSLSWSEMGHVTQLTLGRLGQDETRAIAERVARNKALPDQVLVRIIEQTDGIPLFVEELTKTVLEADILEEREDRYMMKGPLPAFAIPSTLQDSLIARLDRLAPVRQVVQAAACIGRVFDAALVGSALWMDDDALDAALNQLLDAELIFRAGPGSGGTRFVFKHALVQDAAYESLLVSHRRRLHETIAARLEETGEADGLELARHHAGAAAHARAAELYLEGGRQALAESALPEAIGALELGLKSANCLNHPERNRIELGLRVALGAARMANFGWAHTSVSAALEPAFPLAQATGDDEALGSILWGLWVHFQTRTDFPRAHKWLAKLKEEAERNPASDLPVVYDMCAGCQYFWEADYVRAVEHTDHLKSIYEPRHARLAALTNHDPLVFAQHWAGSFADWIRGYPEQSLERLEEAVDLARRVGHPFNLVFALTAGASVLVYLGEAERLLAFCDEAEHVSIDQALGPFAEKVLAKQWRGAASIESGDYEGGHACALEGYDYWNASEGRICTAMFRSWIARGLHGLGRTSEAIEMNHLNIEHCRATGDRYMEPECLRLQGKFLLSTDRSGALRLFNEALALSVENGAKSWRLRAVMSLFNATPADARVPAQNAIDDALSAFTEGKMTRDLVQATQLLS